MSHLTVSFSRALTHQWLIWSGPSGIYKTTAHQRNKSDFECSKFAFNLRRRISVASLSPYRQHKEEEPKKAMRICNRCAFPLPPLVHLPQAVKHYSCKPQSQSQLHFLDLASKSGSWVENRNQAGDWRWWTLVLRKNRQGRRRRLGRWERRRMWCGWSANRWSPSWSPSSSWSSRTSLVSRSLTEPYVPLSCFVILISKCVSWSPSTVA